MKLFFITTFICFNLVSISRQTPIDLSNIKGTEIYLLESECRNQNSYNKYKTASEQKAFIDKYKSNESIPQDKCAFYVDLEHCQIQSAAFLQKSDIEKFDWKSSKIVLTNSGIKKLKELQTPLPGLAFVIRLNEQNVYSGWFWNKASSFGCDRVWTWQDPAGKELILHFGLGSFKCGVDPRTDKTLIQNIIKNTK